MVLLCSDDTRVETYLFSSCLDVIVELIIWDGHVSSLLKLFLHIGNLYKKKNYMRNFMF